MVRYASALDQLWASTEVKLRLPGCLYTLSHPAGSWKRPFYTEGIGRVVIVSSLLTRPRVTGQEEGEEMEGVGEEQRYVH